MSKKLEYMKKHWTRVWLIVVLILTAGIVITYAAYTEVSVVKRVVSTKDSEGELFSSNCMRQDISSRMLSVRSYSVTVCNYDQDKSLTYNPSQISYAFHAELQYKYGDDYYNMTALRAKLIEDDAENGAATYQTIIDKIGENYFICKQEDDSGDAVSAADSADHYFTSANSYTVDFDDQTLAPNVSSTDKFRVTVAAGDLGKNDPDFYVHVWAVPSGNAYHTIHSRIFGGLASGSAASWQGNLKETNSATVDYDFYNYIITGNGAGTVDILWNDDYFEINEFFFSNLSGNTFVQSEPVEIQASNAKYGSGSDNNLTGWKMITLNVDSLNIKSRYEIQLYKVKENTSYTNKTPDGLNETASQYIKCFFTESQG